MWPTRLRTLYFAPSILHYVLVCENRSQKNIEDFVMYLLKCHFWELTKEKCDSVNNLLLLQRLRIPSRAVLNVLPIRV